MAVQPAPAVDQACDCPLCVALLALAESAARNRAAAAERRASIHVVEEEEPDHDPG